MTPHTWSILAIVAGAYFARWSGGAAAVRKPVMEGVTLVLSGVLVGLGVWGLQ